MSYKILKIPANYNGGLVKLFVPGSESFDSYGNAENYIKENNNTHLTDILLIVEDTGDYHTPKLEIRGIKYSFNEAAIRL